MNFEGVKEKTLVLIKPDSIQRGLVGEIIARLEKKGIKLVGLKMINPTKELWREHYAHVADKPFYEEYEAFMTSTPIIAMVWEGLEVVDSVRRLAGVTKSREAEAGSIRGDFGMSIACNVVHTSDSLENAKVEVPRFFSEEELHDYERAIDGCVYMKDELGA